MFFDIKRPSFGLFRLTFFPFVGADERVRRSFIEKGGAGP